MPGNPLVPKTRMSPVTHQNGLYRGHARCVLLSLRNLAVGEVEDQPSGLQCLAFKAGERASLEARSPTAQFVDEIRVLLFVFEAQTANRSQVAFLTGKIARVQVLEEFGGIKNLAHLLGVV